jgi:hypothetical protein
MADIKISALGAIASVAGEDLIAIIDDPAGTPASRKATVTQLLTFIDANSSALNNIVEDISPNLGGTLTGSGFDQTGMGTISMIEQAAANVDVAAEGQVWVKTATPNQLWFTDDAGTDFQLASLAGTETLTNKTISQSQITSLTSDLALKSPLASPTFTGTVVLPDSQALVTPVLGTPTSVVLTNATGTASGLTAGNVTTNANSTGDVTSVGNATTIGADKVLLSMIAPAGKTECISMAVSDNTTDLATGTVFTFYMPYAMTLTDIKASVLTAPTGAGLIVDVHDAGTTIMTTDKLNIDVTEFHTKDAGTQPALTDTALANNAKIEIIIDQVGSTVAGAGLVIYLIGYQS